MRCVHRLYSPVGHRMKPLDSDRYLVWLDARISEIEVGINSDKQQIRALESQGRNAAHACRHLAVMTKRLRLLRLRQALMIEKLHDKTLPAQNGVDD